MSKTPANPIGPYISETYNETIKDNANALSFTIQKLPELNKIKQEFIQKRFSKQVAFKGEER